MRIKIIPERIITFLILFMSLNLSSYDYMGKVMSELKNILQILSFFLAGLLFFIKKKGSFTPLLFWTAGLEIVLFFSTLINEGSFRTYFGENIGIVVIVLIFEVWSSNLQELVYIMLPLMELLCYGNYLTILLFPEGMYSSYKGVGIWYSTSNWLLGFRTSFIAYLLPACLIAFLYQQYGGKRWREMGIYIVSFLTVALSPAQTATSTIGLVILFFMLILVRRGFKFNIYILAFTNVVAFFFVVIFRFQNVILGYFSDILRRNTTTLTGRTLLWDNIFLAIKEKPFWGYGVKTTSDVVNQLKLIFGTNGHNIILHYLYQGGIVQLFVYLLMIAFLCKKLRSVQDKMITQGIIVTLFAFQIMGLTEAYQLYAFMYSLYGFACFADKFDNAAEYLANSRIKLVLPWKRASIKLLTSWGGKVYE